jgi:uncharacterized membrane protein YgdD (TMEM256/DUF423 family)
MNKNLLFAAALSGAIAVSLGAFGAHGLKPLLTPEQLGNFETGARYQFYHTFGAIAAVILGQLTQKKAFSTIGWLFLGGIVLFSGSLYLLSCREVIGLESWKWLGPITPLGGTLFIAGWIWMAILAMKLTP